MLVSQIICLLCIYFFSSCFVKLKMETLESHFLIITEFKSHTFALKETISKNNKKHLFEQSAHTTHLIAYLCINNHNIFSHLYVVYSYVCVVVFILSYLNAFWSQSPSSGEGYFTQDQWGTWMIVHLFLPEDVLSTWYQNISELWTRSDIH